MQKINFTFPDGIMDKFDKLTDHSERYCILMDKLNRIYIYDKETERPIKTLGKKTHDMSFFVMAVCSYTGWDIFTTDDIINFGFRADLENMVTA